MKELPAISVIIPMYNADKYVGECLDSILAQTFQDFEVIVVNDCSTDSSRAVVENYAPKFGERLKLTHTKKNSGCGGVPRNVGLPFARGEYISFLDADDTIAPTAFEELYNIAKNFDADVVACERYYEVPDKFWNDTDFRRQLQPFTWRSGEFVTQPTLLTENLSERVRIYNEVGFLWNLWSKLIRRDFVVDNEITFATSTIAEDFIFTSCLAFTAKKFVLVPNVVNYYRLTEESISHTADKGGKYFRKYVRALTKSFAHLDEFLSGRDFFRQNPNMKYLVLERLLNEILNYILYMYEQTPAHEFDEIVREEFSGEDIVALAALLFNTGNLYRVRLIENLGRVSKLEKIIREDKTYIAELENFIAQSQRHV